MRALAVLALCGLTLAGCETAGPSADNTVTLTPVSAPARQARNAELQGTGAVSLEPLSATNIAPAGASVSGPGDLRDDTTYIQPAGGSGASAAAPRTAVAYETVAPRPVPQRSGKQGPNVVDYALATSHPVGQPVHARSFASSQRAAQACGRYSSANQAQEAFLSAGGPAEDSRGLDPDGDGYACAWDPTPFRNAVR